MPTTLALVVNFTQFELEPHVERALRMAWALSGGRPVNGGHLLEAALVGAQTDRTAAFVKIASLFPLPTRPRVGKTATSPPDLAAMVVTEPVARSFSVAEGFLRDKNRVWGRDYVTLALLAKDDPSLEELAREAGSDIEVIRREWFNFVRSTDDRRAPQSWEGWWRGAGLPLPNEPKASAARNAYLFTWNPSRFNFPELEAHVEKVKKGGSTTFTWSTGNRRDVSLGTRVFLVRQGAEPRGLVGVGTIEGTVQEGPHWDEEQRKAGRTSLLVPVRWVALSREPLLDLPGLIQESGNPTIWSAQAGGVEIDSTTTGRLEDAWPRAWARRLHGLADDHLPEIEARNWIARFDADTGSRIDRLNVDRYVNAFARVMASRALTPPMSIGLFGDWGSGKTFFMDRLHDKIEEIAESPDAETVYWRRICQIRFNAWHYTETNLWASLVTTIFSGLCTFLDGSANEADEFNRLLNQLEVVGELRKAANEKAVQARQRLEDARKRVDEARERLRAVPPRSALSDERVREILGKSIWEVAGSERERLAALLRDAGEWSGRPEFKEAADRLEVAETTVADARALLDEARALASRAGFWWRVLAAAKLHRTRSFWIALGTAVAIPLVFAFAQRLGLREGWAHVWTLIGEALTLAGAAVALVRSRLGGASAVFDRLAVLQANVTRRLEDAETSDRLAFEAARDKSVEEEAAARAALEQSEREETQAAEAYRKAEEAVRESTSQARLGRFIRERTSSADYERHLGLIAMIHRDFQRLSDLMEKARDGGGDEALPRIDRIVLYIDDLDRCYPPQKVVRVLEALHLLLFFPLFVVVVGVDSRWVSRALSRHYQGMLADEASHPPDQYDGLLQAPAYSQDFLEKIFQVPFWLRRMEPAAVQRLVHELITSDEVAPTLVAVPPPDDTPASAAGRGAAGTAPEDPARAAAKRTTAEAEAKQEAIGEPLATSSDSLKITEAEVEFMDRVSPLMPRTPRSVKRFVNIYRLYKAALSPLALARFLGTPARMGNFCAVQILLALVTGTPRFAQKVFRELQANRGGSVKKLSDLVRTISEDHDETSRTTLEALREFAAGDNDLDLDALREVSSLVTRFSVHHMISATPGEAGLG